MSGFKNIKIDAAQSSAFGTIETGELTPIMQGDFVYGLNNQLWNTAVTSGTGATVDTDASRLRIQSGTASGGYAYITSRKILRYRAGQGMTVRFTPLFTAGVANNIQLWGIGEMSANQPLNGYFFGFDGTTFKIFHYNNSATPVAAVAQSSWNGDKVDGTAGTSFTWNKAFGTPVMIKYPYLGYGDVTFWVQNPTTSEWVLVHTIRYANTTATTQLSNPAMQFIGYTRNTATVTNSIMYCGSVGAFISGARSFIGNPKWGMDNNKTGITTETNILTLKNATTYNTVTNRGMIRINSISVGASTATGSAVIVRLKMNTTLGGTPAYTAVSGTTADNGVTITSGNSITSYDVAGTTITGGNYIHSLALATGTNAPSVEIFDLTDKEIIIPPGEILSITGFSTNSATISVAINWSEDI